MGLFYLPVDGRTDSAVTSAYIRVQSAAALSGYNPQYLRRLLRQGRLIGFKIGQLWLIDADGFEQYLFYNQVSVDRRCGPQGLPAVEVPS